MALTTNLVSYWKLDESSGNAADSVGSNTLTNNGTVTYVAGKINNCANFVAASSQFLSITDAAQSGLDILGDMSISYWINFASLPGNGVENDFIDKWTGASSNRSYRSNIIGNASNQNLYFQVDKDGLGATQTQFHIVNAFSTSTWYHLVGVFTAATPKWDIYLNGSAQSTTIDSNAATTIFNSAADFDIGGIATVFSNAKMDEIGIWSRTLTSGEVTTLYNSGSGNQYPFTSFKAPQLSLVGAGI